MTQPHTQKYKTHTKILLSLNSTHRIDKNCPKKIYETNQGRKEGCGVRQVRMETDQTGTYCGGFNGLHPGTVRASAHQHPILGVQRKALALISYRARLRFDYGDILSGDRDLLGIGLVLHAFRGYCRWLEVAIRQKKRENPFSTAASQEQRRSEKHVRQGVGCSARCTVKPKLECQSNATLRRKDNDKSRRKPVPRFRVRFNLFYPRPKQKHSVQTQCNKTNFSSSSSSLLFVFLCLFWTGFTGKLRCKICKQR